jgi:hypothetical protein
VIRQGFTVAGDAPPLVYLWQTTCAGTPDNGAFVTPTTTSAGCWAADFPPSGMDVREWGADATGVANSQPAIQAAMNLASNHKITITAGTYNLCAVQTSRYADSGPGAVIVRSQHNFSLDMTGATFTACNAITSGPGIAYWIFDQNTGFKVTGGLATGNQTGKTGGDTVFIEAANNIDGVFSGQSIASGDWQSNSGVLFDGFWDWHVVFENAYAPNVTKCFDFSFMYDVSIRNTYCSGQFAGGIGTGGVNIFYDTTALSYNFAGLPISDSKDILIEGVYATNFGSGWAIASGSNYKLQGNSWIANVGSTSIPLQGFGGLVVYNNGGANTSVGHPVTNLQSVNEVYQGNGNSVAGGAGILVQNGTITNSDVISGLRISSQFINNIDRAVGISAAGPTNVSNFSFAGLSCVAGTGTVYCLDPNVIMISAPVSTVLANAPVSLTTGVTSSITTLTLPPGIWTVNGWFGIAPGVGTTTTQVAATITGSCSPPTLPSFAGTPGFVYVFAPLPANPATPQYPIGPVTFSTGAPSTTICLGGVAIFSGGTEGGFGSLSAVHAN